MSESPDSAPLSLDDFQRTLVYRREAPVAQVLEELRQLLMFDQQVEGEESRWRRHSGWLGCGTLLTVIATVAGFVMGLPYLSVPLLILVVPLVVLLVVVLRQWMRYARLNLDNRRLRLPQTVLSYLGCDMSPDQVVRIEIDFRNYRDATFLKRQDSTGIFSSQKSFQYAVPWFSLGGQLIDGHRFELSLETLAKRKEKQKRKYTKVREIFRERLELAFRVKAARYPRLAEIGERARAANIPQPFQPLGLRAEQNMVRLVGTTPPVQRGSGRGTSLPQGIPETGVCTADHALQSFLTVYAALALCRA